MANLIQIKRRVSGAAGAPSGLKSGEIAHNEVDSTLYIGTGDDGAGNATSIIALAGVGAFLSLTGAQTVGGAKTFSVVPKSSQDASGGTDLVRKSQFDAGLAGKANASHTHAISDITNLQASLDARMAKSVYDSNDSGKVDHAELADAAPWAGITGKPSTFSPATHGHAIADVTGLQGALDGKAGLASPAFTGAPTAPTAGAAVNSTQIATTAFVATAIDNLINGAPGALDTLQELAAALGDDPDFATTITSSIGNKARKDQNLADLTDAATARANLGLGSMAQQGADNVAITGGTIDGTVIDCGTF